MSLRFPNSATLWLQHETFDTHPLRDSICFGHSLHSVSVHSQPSSSFTHYIPFSVCSSSSFPWLPPFPIVNFSSKSLLLFPSFILSVVNYRPEFLLFLPSLNLFLLSVLLFLPAVLLSPSSSSSSPTTQSSYHCIAWPPRHCCINFTTLRYGFTISRHVHSFCGEFRFSLRFALGSGDSTSFFSNPLTDLRFVWCGSVCGCSLVSSFR